jgi:hypothetical protein
LGDLERLIMEVISAECPYFLARNAMQITFHADEAFAYAARDAVGAVHNGRQVSEVTYAPPHLTVIIEPYTPMTAIVQRPAKGLWERLMARLFRRIYFDRLECPPPPGWPDWLRSACLVWELDASACGIPARLLELTPAGTFTHFQVARLEAEKPSNSNL